ncbi:MAG: type II secretion system minor pseudopilin GspK, partial [Burkholderiaceae bacterium]
QKQWVLRGALDWAQLILREDAKYTTTDNLDEPWAVPLAPTRLDQYVEKDSVDGDVATTQLAGQMIDAQSRFNLTNLATNGVPNPSEIEAFQRLLSFVGVDPQLAVAVAAMVAASQSVPPDLSPAGRQSALTAGATPAKPRVLPMTQADDLLAVPGFTPEIYAKLRDFVVVLPIATPINANTASPEVLAARIDTLSLGDAAALVASRKRAWFRNEGDFSQRLPGQTLNLNQVGFATSWFLINANVRLSRGTLDMVALIQRTGTTTRVVWIRET